MSHADPLPGEPVEIERKFLVVGDGWRDCGRVETIRQGYLPTAADCTVRVRISGDRAFLTVKSASHGGVRAEFEYPIPVDHAAFMLHRFCSGRMIEKQRHWVRLGTANWTVDEFQGAHAGLLLAEIELDRIDRPIELPPWIGREVTGDPRYLNGSLATAAGPPHAVSKGPRPRGKSRGTRRAAGSRSPAEW